MEYFTVEKTEESGFSVRHLFGRCYESVKRGVVSCFHDFYARTILVKDVGVFLDMT